LIKGPVEWILAPMRTPIALALAAAIALPAAARAQAHVDIHFDLPAVLPPLVVVQPGVQVVPEVREEVFFHDGYYWARRDGSWYRARDHRGGWVVVPVREVPPRFASLGPPGHYRNWKAEKEHRKAVRKAEHRREREERREERRDDRRDEHDRGHGHGRGHGRD
jgi:hypothetical protein